MSFVALDVLGPWKWRPPDVPFCHDRFVSNCLRHWQNLNPLRCIGGERCHNQPLQPCEQRPLFRWANIFLHRCLRHSLVNAKTKEYPKSPKYPGSIEPTTHMQMHQLSPPFARIVPGWLLFWELHQWDSLAYPYRSYRTIHRGVATMLAQGISNISNTHIGRQSGCSFVFICLLSIWWDYVRRNYM